MCPEGEDFMPAPPDPEDIIYEEEAAHEVVGEAKERDGADKSEIDHDKASSTDSIQNDHQTSDKEETGPVTES